MDRDLDTALRRVQVVARGHDRPGHAADSARTARYEAVSWRAVAGTTPAGEIKRKDQGYELDGGRLHLPQVERDLHCGWLRWVRPERAGAAARQNRTMATIVLFQSVYGLRPSVLATAERLRSAASVVLTPGLYAGSMAASVNGGFALSRRVGWETIVQRARTTLEDLPADTVLTGLSMGVGVVYALLPERGDAAGLLLLHGIGSQSAALRAGLPVQLHVAEPDELFPPAEVAAWRAEIPTRI